MIFLLVDKNVPRCSQPVMRSCSSTLAARASSPSPLVSGLLRPLQPLLRLPGERSSLYNHSMISLPFSVDLPALTTAVPAGARRRPSLMAPSSPCRLELIPCNNAHLPLPLRRPGSPSAAFRARRPATMAPESLKKKSS
jgi:hypothetical protein